MATSPTVGEPNDDRDQELKAFDETKTGVKGLADGGITKIPRIFIQPANYNPNPTNQNPIPLINLESIHEHPIKRKKVIDEVRAASETWGFFQVINHGICDGILQEMLDGVRRFYEQEDEVKKEWYTRDLSRRVIYNSNFDLFSAPSANWRDTVYCQMAPDAPKPEELPEVCRDIMFEYTNQILKLGKTLFQLFSEALGLKPNHLGVMECGEGLTLLCHYYPLCPQPELTVGTSQHADSDFLTVLLNDGVNGLQILYQNQWVDVPYVHGALVVNIGDLLQMASEGSHDSRILIVASGGKFLPESHVVSAFITDKFAEKQCMGGHTWRYVDAATKAYYWGEFVKSYRWRPDHDAHIRATWKTLAADQYRKTLCSWRTKPKLPLVVNIQIWNKWKEIWSSSQWQNKSEKAKNNRNTEPEGPGTGVVKHIGGSRCFIQHSIKMRDELGRDASAYELFKMMHQKKDGTWVDARSKALDAEMNARFLEASQLDADCESPHNPTPEVQNELYILAVGGVKKRKLYGVGSQAEVLYPEAMSGRATHTRANSMDVAAAKAEAAAATSKVEELTRELTSLRQHVRYLMEHALIDPQSISSSSARDYDDDSTQP